jgi:hypothetical protein
LTVKDFFYNSGNDTGYGFVCASSLDSDRSPYVERVSVLTKGSVTSASDPYGFAQGDAGRGAKLDGAQFSSNSIEAAILFNEVTFIVPNSVGLLVTNGVRVEWLNSFVYFAAEGIKGEQGATGRAGAGQTRLKLAGVSGTFSAAEVIYQLEDSFQSGTYSRTGTTVTITKTAHGLVNGDVIYADYISGTATDGYYTVANSAANTFDVTDTASGTTSGNITFKKADAYGTITTNDGTYLLINGKGVGEFTTGVPTGKTGVIAGDAQLDTAQQKFGTASLLLDGVTDHLSYPTSDDFGFGTTNFAFECFIRPTATTGTQYFLDFRDGSDTDTAPTMYLDGTTLHFAVGNTSQISGGTLSAGTWYHVAAARFGGTTRLFLDGTQLGTYTDSNDYGATKPLGIGGEYSGTNEFGGHIDEIRVSKATARYTGAFTAPTAAFTTDLNTVLLLHFDGTDGSTTITDSGKGVKDIRSSGGDSATSLLTADYAQFGAELRSISSANVYGTKGAIADGAGVKLLLTAHNFAYIGSGADFTNDPDLAVPANEVTETNGGRIFYSATNEKGDFRIGDAFVVDQQTGNVQFQSTSTAQEAANITLSDPTGTTRIFPAFVETGNLRLSGNTLSSTSGNVIVDPSANEDILLNAEVIAPETLYFNTNKNIGILSEFTGALKASSFSGDKIFGSNEYAFWSGNSLRVFTNGITSFNITSEGSGYTGGAQLTDITSNPNDLATATVVLQSTGPVKRISLTNRGSGYTLAPVVSFGSGAASATTTLTSWGKVVGSNFQAGGSGYVSPTADITAPQTYGFDPDSAVNVSTDVITINNHPFETGDRLTYTQDIAPIGGLTTATVYYAIRIDTNTFKLATNLSNANAGTAINLTSIGSGSSHSLQGIQATATVQHSAGAVTGVTITDSGSAYASTPTLTINDSAGVDAIVDLIMGYAVNEVNVSAGDSYSVAPTTTFTADASDTTGSGAAGSSVLGFEIASLTLTNQGNGYRSVPTLTLDQIAGLNDSDPISDATFTVVIDEIDAKVASVTLDSSGSGYETTPVATLTGGGGQSCQVEVNIQSVDGNITSVGSGYAAGTFPNVPFTGGSGSGATATITVIGLGGSVTTAGSGYVDGTYTNVPGRNDITTTFTSTVVSRTKLLLDVIGATGSFNIGNTVTSSSGGTGTVTYVDTVNSPQGYIYLNNTSGTFANNDTITNGGGASYTMLQEQSVNRYLINGNEGYTFNLTDYNTYRIDTSDSSNAGHPIVVSTVFGLSTRQYRNPGDAGSYFEIVVGDVSSQNTNTSWSCQVHGTQMTEDGTVNIGSGSPGVSGTGITFDVTVSGGAVTAATINTQGSGYGINDVFYFDGDNLGVVSPAVQSSNAEFTIQTNDTSISSITDISTSGSGYQIGDVLSVDPSFDLVGSGGGFQFTTNKVGFASSITIIDGGKGFETTDTPVLGLVGGVDVDQGTGIELDIASVSKTEVFYVDRDETLSLGDTAGSQKITIKSDGEFTAPNWGVDSSGSISVSAISASGIATLGSLSVSGNSALGGTLTVTGSLTANGSTNTINNALVNYSDGSAADPSLSFQNSNTTGIYRAGADDIGLSISGTQRGSISASGFDLSTDLVVDQNLTETTPFFRVNAVGESVDIGAEATQIRINNDASIEAIGSDTDVDITFSTKGQSNLVLSGGANKGFSVTDGSTETFNIDSETGDTTVGGKLDINGNIRIRDNIISSDISLTATTSFGQIITVSATGTATGYTDNTYTGVPSTSSGSGTGATFDVTVSGGDITAIAVNAGGAGYVENEQITLDTATIGSGSGKTIRVTDIEGLGLVLKPSVGKNVKVDSTAMFVVPAGDTNQRPPSNDRQTGGIRFNTQQQQFEGYNGSDFVSLGGVRDVNQDTYILTELAPGTNEDTFFFFNQGVNSLDIVQDKFKLYTAKTFDTSGTLILNGVNRGDAPLNVQSLGTSILQVRSQKDLEIVGGQRLKAVGSLGEVATIGSITSTNGAYTPSQTFTGVVSSSEFEGSGATFDVTTDANGDVTSVVLNAPGSGYEVSEQITILGTNLGGASPAEDVTFDVVSIANAQAAFARLDILNDEYVTRLDSKPFLSLDATGSEAGLKINRGWNGGTQSYLTVFDSTATFMELDDCRLEGGQLSSFGASSTIVQFDKTSFKGAKTLVTIESDDGKVHMLEVTSVCAASGTTAYATITNSVTSANDLVDADVVVVGNNVQVNLTKSTAATSSTSFTGRFTTTKVKV